MAADDKIEQEVQKTLERMAKDLETLAAQDKKDLASAQRLLKQFDREAEKK